ncbi:uncharacterized protein LOC135483025 [Lineus longissimus]|uniref:uncharacterized protein LOC135483025 n=1 Tax=Lineus longissimus TaxID=88925 RepID=UPI00315C7FEA
MPFGPSFNEFHLLTICCYFGFLISFASGKQTLGSTCEIDEDCGIPFETCDPESDTCVCRTDYAAINGYCKPASLVRLKRNVMNYGQNCTVDGDCGTNELCDSGGTGLCSCNDRYWSSTGSPSVTGCDVYVSHGLDCTGPSNCTGPNEDCKNTLCSCISGYTSSQQTLNITGCDTFTFGSSCISDSDCMTGRETCDVAGDSTCICASGWARSASNTNCDTFYGVSMTIAGINFTEFQAIESTFASAVANATNNYCSSNTTTVAECCNIQTSYVPSGVLQITNASLISFNASYDTALNIDLVLQTPDDNELCAAAALHARRRKRFVIIGAGFGSLNPSLSLVLLTAPSGITTITQEITQAVQTTFGYTPTVSFTVVIVAVPTAAPATTNNPGTAITQPHVAPTLPSASVTTSWVFILVVTIGSIVVLGLIIVVIVSCVRTPRPHRSSRISHIDPSEYEGHRPRSIVVVERVGERRDNHPNLISSGGSQQGVLSYHQQMAYPTDVGLPTVQA